MNINITSLYLKDAITKNFNNYCLLYNVKATYKYSEISNYINGIYFINKNYEKTLSIIDTIIHDTILLYKQNCKNIVDNIDISETIKKKLLDVFYISYLQ